MGAAPETLASSRNGERDGENVAPEGTIPSPTNQTIDDLKRSATSDRLGASAPTDLPSQPDNLKIINWAAGSTIFVSLILYTVNELLIAPSMGLTLVLTLATIGATGILLVALSYTRWFSRHWRITYLTSSLILLAGFALVSSIDGNLVVLFLAPILVVLSAGAMVPWESRWEAGLGLAAVLILAAQSFFHPHPDAYAFYHWLGTGIAVVAGYASSRLGENYRTSVAQHVAALKHSQLDLQASVHVRDQTISAHQLAQEMLRTSQLTLRKIFDAISDVIVVTRLSDGAYIDFNQAFHSAGLTAQDLERSSDGDGGIWANPAQRDEFQRRVDAEGTLHNMEVDFVLHDSDITPFLLSAVRVELDGEPCIVSFARNIATLKEAARKLGESENTLRTIFDACPDAISVARASDGRYMDVNRRILDAWRLDQTEVLGRTDEDLDIWHDKTQRTEFINRLKVNRMVRNMEVDLRNHNGSVTPTLMSAALAKLGGVQAVVTFTRDITAIKETQRELVAAREAALASSQAKSEFLSIMSHEIRTPMNAILGMTDLLAETDLGDEQRRYVNTVVSNGNVLLELINGILDLARIESGRLSLEAVEFDPREVAERALDTIALRAHEKGLELLIRFLPGIPHLLVGDSMRLSQILINLVGNAIKFTPHGEVLVTVEAGPTDDSGPTLKFTVADTGIGIAPDQLELLFKPFTQADSSTSRKFGGSGLGLSIADRLVGLMNGKIEVQSTLGEGSVFAFTARFANASTPAPSIPLQPLPDLSAMRVLLVDRNAACRSILSRLLNDRGAEVNAIDSGIHALEAIERTQLLGLPYQILLIDGMMSEPTAYEITKRFASNETARPQIVMMLSTEDLVMKIAQLRVFAIDNYVVKPVKRADLMTAMSRAHHAARTDAGAVPVPIPPLPPPPARSALVDRPLHILLADDSADNRLLVQAYLKKTPYRLEQAENGQEAIDQFVAGQFDLVLMDIQMPIVDGYEAVRTIRRWEQANHKIRTPIIALTASALGDAASHTRDAGCDVHVTKPVKKSTLLDAIRHAVQPNHKAAGRSDPAHAGEDIWRTV
jgi:two-component system sensor histidine kinase/response regulator